ncbi:MAG TPA: rhomboid family intramembrane serine protease, partial [Kandleria vitulina]|nr:rhomboid family intramembrane serine protease [Kandleria vitulina]
MLTANFLHFGLVHIFVNCYSLYNVGLISEEIFGKRDYAIICLASA